MKQYILKLKTTSTTNYALYDGTTALTDAELTTLFTTAGSAYFTFDFDSLTPSATNAITIVNSSNTAVVTNTNLTDTIVETKDFKGTWSASATAFDTFVALSGVAMDEAQLSDLMGKIKSADKKGLPEYIWPADFMDLSASDRNHIEKIVAAVGSRPFILKMGPTVTSGTIYYGSSKGGRIRIYRNMAFEIWHGTDQIGSSYFMTGPLYLEDDNKITDALFWGSTGTGTSRSYPLMTRFVVDNLTSTSTIYPLSANQGKVLADRIGTLSNLTTTAKTSAVVAINEVNAKVLTNAGTPTTSTVGTVGQLLADTTNGKLYICTDATNPYVWEEVGAGGGGIQNALIIREWS